MSEAARDLAEHQWRAQFPEAAAALLQKTTVMLPPQRVIMPVAQKPRNTDTHFAFIGRDLYRKGGLEMLQAFHRLFTRGDRDWRLTLVGDLESYGDYASHTDVNDRNLALALIEQMSPHVNHHNSLPNSGAIDVLCESDYLLLPTLSDTFGYIVLEAQACGAVVITTNVRALPEINDRETGFLLELQLDERRDVHKARNLESVKARLVDCLEESIYWAIALPLQDRHALATRATTRLKERHCPAKHTEMLSDIYLESLQSA